MASAKGTYKSCTFYSYIPHYSLLFNKTLHIIKVSIIYVTYCQMNQPEVSMLMIHYQAEAGNNWELKVILETRRAARNHSLTFRDALQLCLIIVALWSRLWYAVGLSVMPLRRAGLLVGNILCL